MKTYLMCPECGSTAYQKAILDEITQKLAVDCIVCGCSYGATAEDLNNAKTRTWTASQPGSFSKE